jgi:hypothetical protein
MTLVLQVLAAAAAAAALTELASRLWLHFFARAYVWPPYYHVETDVDPKILPNLSPHSRFQVNSLGARGDEPPPSGVRAFRVLACGGSAVECFSLDQEEAWPQVVQTLLNRPESLARLGAERAVVWNVGKSGFTTDALCYAFPRLLPRFAPIDVLTIVISISAVNYWTRVGTPDELPELDPPWADFEWHPELPWSWHARRSAAAEVVRRLRQVLGKPIIVREGAGRRFAKQRKMRAEAREVRDAFGDTAQWVAHYEESLTRAIELARRHARRVVLIRQPWFNRPDPTPEENAMLWNGSVGDVSAQFCDVFYSHRVICELMRMMNDATTRVGRATGTDVLRPEDVLEPSAKTFYDHAHLTPAGARIVGEYVAAQLLELEARPADERSRERPDAANR